MGGSSSQGLTSYSQGVARLPSGLKAPEGYQPCFPVCGYRNEVPVSFFQTPSAFMVMWPPHLQSQQENFPLLESLS